MITLHQITIKNFKSLRAIDLVFPAMASILIEGFNESGKSSLFEAVIFALYGEPLITEETGTRGKGRAESVIAYQAQETQVRMVVQVGPTRLEVQRTLRHKGSTQARLDIWYDNGRHEVVTGQTSVNQRMLQEMGNLTKDTLLNSCFVEQKQLGKLEEMGTTERKESLEQLLNLARLQRIQKQFEVSKDERGAADQAQQKLMYAQQQMQIRERETALVNARRQREMFDVATLLAEQDAARAALANLLTKQAHLTAERQKAARLDDRHRALAAAQGPLAEMRNATQQIAQLTRDLQSIANQIAACDRSKSEELPHASSRKDALHTVETLLKEQAANALAIEHANEAADITTRSAALDADEATSRAQLAATEAHGATLEAFRQAFLLWQRTNEQHTQAQRDLAAWERRQQEYTQTQAELTQTTNESSALAQRMPQLVAAQAQAQAAHRAAVERDALQQWVNGADDAARVAQVRDEQERHGRELAHHESHASNVAAHVRKAQQRLLLCGGGALFAVVAFGALMVLGQTWGAIFLALAAGLGWMGYRARQQQVELGTQHSAAQAATTAAKNQVMQLQADERALQTIGGGKLRADAEHTLHEHQLAVPASVADAQHRLSLLPTDQTTIRDAAARLRAAADALQQAQQQQMLTEQQQTATQRRLATFGELAAEGVALQAAYDTLNQQQISRERTVNAQSQELSIVADADAIARAVAAQTNTLRTVDGALAAASGQRQALADRRLHLSAQAPSDSLDLHSTTALAEGRRPSSHALHDLTDEATRLVAAITIACTELAILPESVSVQQALGRVTTEMQHIQVAINQRPTLLARVEQCQNALAAAYAQHVAVRASMYQLLPELQLDHLTEDELEQRLQDQQAGLDGDGITRTLTDLDHRLGQITAEMAARQEEITNRQAQIDQLSLDLQPADAQSMLLAATPETAAVYTQQIEALGSEIYHLRTQHEQLAQTLGLAAEAESDLAECEAEAATQAHAVRVKEMAVKIVSAVRDRMIQKVLPQTTQNMRQLLPILTLDRYRDCEITADYKLQILDDVAGRPVAKNVFSVGARDQFSLALRLAFALATLPEELGTTPGFIFLDEPLSSFDGPRSDALVQLLTHGQICENFSQIFVISHNLMFDRHAFTHHLRLEYGMVVESTLPQQVAG